MIDSIAPQCDMASQLPEIQASVLKCLNCPQPYLFKRVALRFAQPRQCQTLLTAVLNENGRLVDPVHNKGHAASCDVELKRAMTFQTIVLECLSMRSYTVMKWKESHHGWDKVFLPQTSSECCSPALHIRKWWICRQDCKTATSSNRWICFQPGRRRESSASSTWRTCAWL